MFMLFYTLLNVWLQIKIKATLASVGDSLNSSKVSHQDDVPNWSWLQQVMDQKSMNFLTTKIIHEKKCHINFFNKMQMLFFHKISVIFKAFKLVKKMKKYKKHWLQFCYGVLYYSILIHFIPKCSYNILEIISYKNIKTLQHEYGFSH